MDHSYPYIASLTREPFLFYEMRSTAKLMVEGNSDDAIVKEIVEQNLFQYPTEKSITRMAKACIKRLHALEDDSLVAAIASQPTDVAKQICLYALMKQSRLVWEFMLTVIGEKYRLRDTSFGKIDLNTFFMRLQEQNDTVASWSDSTITKLKQIIARVLVETEYLDNRGADHLNPVWLHPILENAIRSVTSSGIIEGIRINIKSLCHFIDRIFFRNTNAFFILYNSAKFFTKKISTHLLLLQRSFCLSS